MARDNNKGFASVPKPISLDAPESTGEFVKGGRRRVSPPRFEEPAHAERGADGRRHMPPPPPSLRPGDVPRRRRKKPPPENSRVKPPSFFRRVLGIRINPVAVSIVSWGIAGIATIVLLVWFVTGLFIYNAFAVYIDGEHVGYIPIRDELTSEDFHNYAVISLQNSLAGARVRVNETITIEETRTSNSNRMQQSEMFGRLQTMFTFEIAATAIYVDGNFEVLLRTASCLNHVKHDLEYEFRNDYTVRAEFIEGWEERIYYVDPEEADFWTAEEAYHVLSRPTMQMYPYIVRDGDFLGTIAVRFGTRVDIIMRDNNLPNTDIFPGDRLYILTSRPLLSVRTFDEIVTIEAVEMPIETRYNPAMAQAMTRTIQEGTPGQQRSVLQIMREDGIERSRTVLDAEVIVEPVARIIEVGTGTGGMEVR